MSDDSNSLNDYAGMSDADVRRRASKLRPLFVSADVIAQIIDEHAVIENGRVANVAYLAVKIAETIESDVSAASAA